MRRPAPIPSVAVAYLRVSTEDQKLGPEAQRSLIRSWADQNGVTVVAWHHDHGVSGGTELSSRPGLLAALEDVRSQRAGCLLVAKRDRLARDVVIAATVESILAKHGAKVVAADGTANGDGPAEKFMRVVVDGAAAYERDLIRQRTRAALAVIKARGERAGTVPYGYRAVPTGETRLVRNRTVQVSRLEVDPQEQLVINYVRSQREQGASMRTIASNLTALGYRSRRGKPLGLAQVHAIVQAFAASERPEETP